MMLIQMTNSTVCDYRDTSFIRTIFVWYLNHYGEFSIFVLVVYVNIVIEFLLLGLLTVCLRCFKVATSLIKLSYITA